MFVFNEFNAIIRNNDSSIAEGLDQEFYLAYRNILFPFSLSLKKSEKFVVFLPGAFNINEPKPKFQRKSYFKDLSYTCLSCFDPTLFMDPNLSLGWFQGNKNNFYIEYLTSLLLQIINDLGIENKNILFFGTSAGGFSALKVAQSFPASNVYLGNIQTDILKYYKNPVAKMLEICFPNVLASNQESHRFDVFDSNVNLNIFYAQNIRDEFHYENHYLPYVEFSKNKIINHEFVVYDHIESKHKPISKQFELDIIRKIFEEKTIKNLYTGMLIE